MTDRLREPNVEACVPASLADDLWTVIKQINEWKSHQHQEDLRIIWDHLSPTERLRRLDELVERSRRHRVAVKPKE